MKRIIARVVIAIAVASSPTANTASAETSSRQINPYTESVGTWLERNPSQSNDILILMHSAMTIKQANPILDRPCSWYLNRKSFESNSTVPHAILASLYEMRGRCEEDFDIARSTAYLLRAAQEWSYVFAGLPDPLGHGLVLETIAAASRAQPAVTSRMMDATQRMRPHQITLMCARLIDTSYARAIADWERISKRTCPVHRGTQT